MQNQKNNLWTGVVEDVNDPEQMGRVRVRIFGLHTPDILQLPVTALPWSSVVMPVTSACVGGIGQSATGLVKGSWVTGVFRDPEDSQDPMILGSIPGKSTMPHPENRGSFADADGAHPYREGSDLPSASHDQNYKNSIPYMRKKALEIKEIRSAVAPQLSSIDPLTPPPAERTQWTMPSVADTTAPIYPHNHVIQTLSGHTFERDDTPGAERISEMHRTGTHTEMLPDGSRKVVVTGKSYRAVFSDDNVYIHGSCNITIAGNARTLVKGDYNLEVEGDYTEYIKGSKLQKIGQSHKSEISGEVTTNIAGNRKSTVNATDELNVTGNSTRVIGGNESRSVYGDSTQLTLGTLKTATAGDSVHATSGTSESSASALKLNSTGNTTLTAGTVNLDSTGNMALTGAFIDLN